MTQRTQGQSPSRQGEHLCRTYADDHERARQVSGLVRDGLARGQRVLYYADTHPPHAALDRLRADAAEVGAARERGQLRVESAADAYLGRLPFDPDLMIAGLRASCREALSQGWTGLRVVTEMDWCARPAPGADRVLEYELRLDGEVLADLPVTGICLYSRYAAARTPAKLAAAAHLDVADTVVTLSAGAGTPQAGAGLAALPLRPGGGVRLAGSADLDNRPALVAVLAAATRMPASVVDVDLRDVDYVDAAGAAVLARTAAVLAGQDRRLVLHHAPPSLRRVAALFPDECRDLEMTA